MRLKQSPVELVGQGQLVVDEFIGVLGRAALEAVLELSAAQVAGAPHPGKSEGEVRRHAKQRGRVCQRRRCAWPGLPVLMRQPFCASMTRKSSISCILMLPNPCSSSISTHSSRVRARKQWKPCRWKPTTPTR